MNQVDQLLHDLAELKAMIGDRNLKQLHPDLVERMIKRLDSFAGECAECEKHLIELHDEILNLKKQHESSRDIHFKEYKQKVAEITSHLQKAHQLVSEGYYIGIYMSLGISLGLVFGLAFFDNIALGLPIGLAIGLAIGAGLDADAKKKGKTI